MDIKDIDEELDVLCQIDHFRYLSNLKGLPLLDSTYLELVITDFLKGKKVVCFEGIIYLEKLHPLFKVKSIKGVKKILDRLDSLGCFPLFKKIGKYHENKYAISVNSEYTKYFFQTKKDY